MVVSPTPLTPYGWLLASSLQGAILVLTGDRRCGKMLIYYRCGKMLVYYTKEEVILA
jgi:hypothetical protein